jgi:hypothetical protein
LPPWEKPGILRDNIGCGKEIGLSGKVFSQKIWGFKKMGRLWLFYFFGGGGG